MTGLKRFLVVFVAFVLCSVLQMIVLPNIRYLVAVPNLLLILVMATGFLYGRGAGLAAGVAAGLILDIVGSGTYGFYTLILAILGFCDGLLSEKMESEMILILYLLYAVNDLVYHAYTYMFAFLIRKSFTFIPYVTKVLFPEFLLSLVLFLPVYGGLIFISKRWDLKVNKGAVKVV